MRPMAGRVRRRGLFEGSPRVLYRRTGPRYLAAVGYLIVFNGIVVALFGVIALLLYVNLSVGETALFAAASALAFGVEGALAAGYFRRAVAPARAWLGGARIDDAAPLAWSAAARAPRWLAGLPSLYVVGAIGVAASDLLVAGILGLPVNRAVLLFPMS